MSIASKQGDLIKSGFLNKLGTTDRGESLALNASVTVLVEIYELLISEAQKNLNRDGTNASGKLEESIRGENIRVDGSVLSLDVMIIERYKFINDGVKGVKSGAGKYKFKNLFVSQKMRDSIKSWILSGKAKFSSVRKPKSKTEEKNKGLKSMSHKKDIDNLSFVVSRSIKKKGIKATHFFTKAIETTEKEYKRRLADAFKIDIIESLK